MSDTQGERPEESTPESTMPAAPTPPEQSPVQPDEPTAAAPAPAVDAPVEPVAPAVSAPAAPTGAGQAPAQPTPPALPPQPAAHGWHAPQPGARPAGAPAGYPAYPQQGQPYAGPRPQGYAGQPAPAPQYASAFGAPAAPRPELNQTQPTVPFERTVTDTAPVAPKKKSGAGKMVGFIVAAAIVSGAAGLGGAYVGTNLFTPAGGLPAAGPSTITVNNTDSVNQTTAISAKVLPSVVTISVSGGSAGGTGSGVVLTSDGYVVTNTHVVTLDGATADATIRVTTSDGRVFDAEIVGTDPTYDLAVIKLKDASDLTPIDFADSSDLNVGDETIAIGAPLGLSNTVTTGIVSALNRSIQIASSAAPDSSDTEGDSQDQGQESPFEFDFGQGQSQTPSTTTESISIAVIQTDAAINPGNSGGALVDGEGKLIGINVAIATAGGSSGQSGSIGVGFSIPSNIVKRVTGEIIDSGAATHGLLGASVQDAASVADSTITGAYIAKVSDGGAAAQGGLKEGDIVTDFNGIPVTGATDLTAQVRAAAAGSQAKVTFVRDGRTQTAEVTLGTLAK